VAKDGGTKTAQVEPLHSVRGLSLDAIRVLPQAVRLSRPLALAHGLASLTMMRGLSSAPRCSAAGCAALRCLYARCRRSVPLCGQVRPAAADWLLLLRLSNLPRFSATDSRRLRCSCAARGCGREVAIDCAAASPPDRPTAPPPRLRRASAPSGPSRCHRARRRCRRRAAVPPDPPRPRRWGGTDAAPLDPPMRRRRRPRRWGSTDAALLRHLTCPCAESTALLCDAPALLPTHELVLATCELLAPAVLYSVCCLCYAAHLRRAASFIVHRRAAHHRAARSPLAARAACSPRRRPPPRSSLRHSLGASSLTANRRAARHLTARAPPH